MSRFIFAIAVMSLLPGCSQNADHSTDQTDFLPETIAAQATTSDVTQETASIAGPVILGSKHLTNPVQIHPKVISGGLPEGDAAFEELRKLGVKTIISVDGAKPDIEIATKFGMRYVHLPHGYSGIPKARAQELGKAVRKFDGPIYIHCHHGKHRSPAAATVACVTGGLIEPSSVLPILQLAGTNPNYIGLYESAEQARPIETAVLDALPVEFRETVEILPLAEAMVSIEHTHDHLKKIAAAGWRAPTDHQDLEPAHEALIMREHFTELLRLDEVQQQPENFRKLVSDSESSAKELTEALRNWNPTSPDAAPPESLYGIADRIAAGCKACHEKYRDTPLSVKQSMSNGIH